MNKFTITSKSYLLLGNERSKLDTTTQKFLIGSFSGILNSKFINSNNTASSTEKDSLKSLFRNYISFFVATDEWIGMFMLFEMITHC